MHGIVSDSKVLSVLPKNAMSSPKCGIRIANTNEKAMIKHLLKTESQILYFSLLRLRHGNTSSMALSIPSIITNVGSANKHKTDMKRKDAEARPRP